jgi:hypothetical protein
MALDSTNAPLTLRQINQISATLSTPEELPGGLFEFEKRLANGDFQSTKLSAGILLQGLTQQLPGPNNRKDLRKYVRAYDTNTPEYYPGASTLESISNPEFLCLSTECEVTFGPAGNEKVYKIAYDPTGPLQVYEDGRFTGGKVPARWVLKDSPAAATTGIETFNDLTDRYPRGKQVIALLPGSTTARLFELQPQNAALTEILRANFTSNRMPAPTGLSSDVYWIERPLTPPGYVGFQQIGVALARQLVALQQVTPARFYRVLRYGEPPPPGPGGITQAPPRAAYDVLIWGLTPKSFSETLAWQVDNATNAVTAEGSYNLAEDQFTAGSGGLGFTPITANQYGTHPAFSSQAALNAYLLSNTGSTPAQPPAPTGLAVDESRQASFTPAAGTTATDYEYDFS